MTIESVKVFGERNCGTNFLTRILESNTRLSVLRHAPLPDLRAMTGSLPKPMRRIARERIVDQVRMAEFPETFGWKHARVEVDQLRASKHFATTLFVFILRNPFSFLNSLYRRPYNHVLRRWRSKGRFLRTPWLCNLRDNVDTPLLDGPVELWNRKIRSYDQAHRDRRVSSILIRYEDLVTNPEAFRAELQDYCELTQPELVVPQRAVKKQDRKTFAAYRDEVLRYSPGIDFSRKDLEFIEERLDRDLVERYYPMRTGDGPG